LTAALALANSFLIAIPRRLADHPVLAVPFGGAGSVVVALRPEATRKLLRGFITYRVTPLWELTRSFLGRNDVLHGVNPLV
jgi:hypothetical protein